jgi:hypothetical protein
MLNDCRVAPSLQFYAALCCTQLGLGEGLGYRGGDLMVGCPGVQSNSISRACSICSERSIGSNPNLPTLKAAGGEKHPFQSTGYARRPSP